MAFAGGWLLLAVALVSPLCRLAATLVSAHMVQHAILVALAPPLLVLGMPNSAELGSRRQPPSGTYLVTVAVAYAAVIWLAHAPEVYEAALRDAGAHLALVGLLLATSLAFWAAVLRDPSGQWRASAYISGTLMCFTAMVQTGLLGALLTFARTPWYPILAARTAGWALDPLSDQQIAGLIMWVPMSAIYIAGCILLTWRWMQADEASMSTHQLGLTSQGVLR